MKAASTVAFIDSLRMLTRCLLTAMIHPIRQARAPVPVPVEEKVFQHPLVQQQQMRITNLRTTIVSAAGARCLHCNE